MMTIRAFHRQGVSTIEDPDRISEAIGRENVLVWVDVEHENDGELAILAKEFSLHPLAMEDATKHGQRPKLEVYPTHAFIVCYASGDDPHDLPEVDIFVGPNWIITVRQPNAAGRAVDLDEVEGSYAATCGEHEGVSFLLYRLLDRIVDGYFDLVDHLDGQLEALEEQIFSELEDDGSTGPHRRGAAVVRDGKLLQRDLLTMRKELLTFRRKVVPFREVLLAVLRQEVAWVRDAEILLYLQDVLDHLLRVIDEVDSQRELVDNAVDAHLAAMSNRTNEIMKKTSSWGAILVTGALITGIYGMNFKHMPELTQRFGYPAALLVMVGVMGALYLYFRRKRWL
jgi:magnesium transporter